MKFNFVFRKGAKEETAMFFNCITVIGQKFDSKKESKKIR